MVSNALVTIPFIHFCNKSTRRTTDSQDCSCAHEAFKENFAIRAARGKRKIRTGNLHMSRLRAGMDQIARACGWEPCTNRAVCCIYESDVSQLAGVFVAGDDGADKCGGNGGES